MASYWATCRTDGCGSNGIAIDVGNLDFHDDVTGETIRSSVTCGPCGQTITDISDSAPAEPNPLPEGVSDD